MAEVRLLELRNTYKWGGGPDKTILLSAEKHDSRRVSVVVVYIRDVRDQEFQITEMAKGRGLTYYEIPENGKFDFRVLGALRDIILRHDINMIHGHDYKSDLFAYLIRRIMRKRKIALVSTAHAWVMLGRKGELYRRLDLFLMKRFDHLFAVSKATQEEMMAAGIPQSKTTVLYNGIDTETWSREHIQSTVREELGIPQSSQVLGYVGRIMPEKDLETWIRAAAIVAKRYPHAKYVLVGEGRDGTTLDELKALAASLGIADQLIFPGFRRDLPQVYAAFDVFVMSSLREGLPNSILEAMALGVPVVTTDVAGAKELVVNNETGFVVDQKDVQGLASSILKILDHETIRSNMGLAGRERVENDFSFLQRLRRIEDLYSQILEEKTYQGSSRNPAVAY